MPQAGFEPPLVDDTSYEADALPTKPPWLDAHFCYVIKWPRKVGKLRLKKFIATSYSIHVMFKFVLKDKTLGKPQITCNLVLIFT